MLMFYCSVCFGRSSSYGSWIDHLLTSGHQLKVKKEFSNWDDEKNSRAIVATGFCPFTLGMGVVLTFPKFLQYISKRAIVTDFYFCNRSKYCVALLNDTEEAERLVQTPHVFMDNSLDVCLKSTLTSEDWASLKAQFIFIRHASLCDSMSKLDSLDDQLHFFFSKQPFSVEVRATRQKIVSDLKELLQDRFPDGFLSPIGNQYAYPYNRKPAFHIVAYLPNKSREEAAEFLSEFEINDPSIFCNVKNDKDSPTIICKHTSSGITCNIHSQLKFGVHQFRLLSFLEQYDPRVHPLITLVSYWSTYYFDLTNHVTSNSTDPFVLLVIFFLIRRKILPPIIFLHQSPHSIFKLERKLLSISDDDDLMQEIRHTFGKKPPLEVDPDTGKPTARCILHLIRDFFQFYEAIDFGKYVISLPRGELIEKIDFDLNPDLASTMKPFDFPNFPELGKKWVNSPMSVQDPCNVYDNVTDLLSEVTVTNFVKLCNLTGKNLETMLAGLNNNSVIHIEDIFKSEFFSQIQTQSSNVREEGMFSHLHHRQPEHSTKKNDDGNPSIILVSDFDYKKVAFPVVKQMAQFANFSVNFVNVVNGFWCFAIEEMLDHVWEDVFMCTVTKEITADRHVNNNVNGTNGGPIAKVVRLGKEAIIREKLLKIQCMDFVARRTYIVKSDYNVWRSRPSAPKFDLYKMNNSNPMELQQRVTETVRQRKKAKTPTCFECNVEFSGRYQNALARFEIRNTPPVRKKEEGKRHFNAEDALELMNFLKLLSNCYLHYRIGDWANE